MDFGILSFLRTTFKIICILATFLFMVIWVHTFLLNEDTTTIEKRPFLRTKTDKIPVLSLCFEQSFEGMDFSGIGDGLTRQKYLKYLMGKEFDVRFLKIDYYDISTNISDFILSYNVNFINDTVLRDITYNVSFNKPYHTGNVLSWGTIKKCFGIEITDPKVTDLIINMKRNIFPNNIRSSEGGFVSRFHYPGQIVKSDRTDKREWEKRDNLTNFNMLFTLNAMGANIHRYKSRYDNCVQNWTGYDNLMIQNHINRIGCKSPLFGKEYNGTLCTNEIDHHNAYFKTNKLRDTKPPCQEIDFVDYGVIEKTAPTKKKFNGKNHENYVSMKFRIQNSHYTAVVQNRAVDFQSLIGYVGGYIGLFTGFALAETPDLLFKMLMLARKGVQIFV